MSGKDPFGDGDNAAYGSGYLLLGCSIISLSLNICMLTLLLMPLAGLLFCVGFDFVTPFVVIFIK
jgi:hypothetical protein